MTRPEERLAQALSAIDDANASGDRVKSAVRTYVRDKLSHVPPYAPDGERALMARRRELESDMLDVAKVASAAGLPGMREVAYAASGLLAAHARHGFWRPDALRLHLDALALLTDAPDPAARERILEPLRTLREGMIPPALQRG